MQFVGLAQVGCVRVKGCTMYKATAASRRCNPSMTKPRKSMPP